MNQQREAFKGKVAEHMKSAGASPHGESGGGGGKMESRIEHHVDGANLPPDAPKGTQHTVYHHDGEVSHHPNMPHAAMHLAAKHEGEEHGHIQPHAGGGATTHHATMDGVVQGPDEHGSEEEAYNHLKGSIGEGAGMEGGEGMMPNEGGQEDSSFE